MHDLPDRMNGAAATGRSDHTPPASHTATRQQGLRRRSAASRMTGGPDPTSPPNPEEPMDARDQILEQIDDRQEDWLRLLTELVRRPSENPPGDTRAAADCVVEHLKRQGYAPEVIEP